MAVPLDKFDAIKDKYTEVSCAEIGGEVVNCSNDFFASRHNLIKKAPAVVVDGFGPSGKLYDGWESSRHRSPDFDWAIIRLGAPSTLAYVDIDTAKFNGNECPESQVFGLLEAEGAERTKLLPTDSRWEELLPVVEIGPDSRHVFELGERARQGTWSAVMVRMIPDGGMARFRAYGTPVPPSLHSTLPAASVAPVDLVSPLVGGRIVACSNAHYSPATNLLLRGRGHDMSDGWESARSRPNRGKYGPGGELEGQERKEWAVARLGVPGVISYVEIDTAYHPGNYPVSAQIEATTSADEVPGADAEWTVVVPKAAMGPHRQHWLASVVPSRVFTHVRLSIFPDGGLKRLRVYGHGIVESAWADVDALAAPECPTITALPLTYEAFKPYGAVIQAWDLPSSAPKGIPVTTANQGTAAKFHRLAPIYETYPDGVLKRGGVALAQMHAAPQYDVRKGATIPVLKLERHAATSQAFIPMGRGVAATEGQKPRAPGGTFLILAALNGADDRPDMTTLRAFLPTAAQGISYNQGVWHSPMLTLNSTMDYCCVDAQSGDAGLTIECETIEHHFADVYVPPYDPPAVAPRPTPAGQTLPNRPGQLIPNARVVRPEPITHAAWAPYGELVRPYPNPTDAPDGILHGGNPQLGIVKLSWLSNLANTYPQDANAVTSIGVYRATPKDGLVRGKPFDIRYMERHPYTSQAFVPMDKAQWTGKGENALPPGGCFLVVVADNGKDDRPDPSTLKAFIMESGVTLNYKPGTWHHPVLILDETLDLACIETQISTGTDADGTDPRDCELLSWEGDEVFGRVQVPDFEV